LMPETRDTARKAWGLEIINMWGCVEVGHIGIECDAHQGMHMSDDLVITEFVDHDDSRQATQRPSIAFWSPRCSGARYL
jgi:phenylacetate-coenzyme A ligase PaaK-like adenylate-forming protein